MQGIIAGGPEALTRSVEGAEDDADAGAAALAALEVGPLDSVVGVSASGRAPFVLGALAEAGRREALTVSLSCNEARRCRPPPSTPSRWWSAPRW